MTTTLPASKIHTPADDGIVPQHDMRAVPITQLRLSTSHSQAERRAHFDKTALLELAESIRTVGLLQPLVVRAMFQKDGGGDGFQIIAGERRYLAAQQAGLQIVSVNVRKLTDDQVLEVQLVENLQREDLHELAEAEGYEGLMKLGHSVEEIAEKVGVSKAYVYARLKLTALCSDARKAFYAGKLTSSTAVLIARIPAKLQAQALKEITTPQWGDEIMSVRAAALHIHDKYMLRLDQAGFPTGDADLLPAAGPCGTCPKRTGNQPELFSDVKGTDVCTDPLCFKAKRQAQAERLIAAAEAKGQNVIMGKEAKKIAPHGAKHDLQGYVCLDRRCYQDSKDRTYRQLLGKGFEAELLQDPESGQIVEVAREAAVNKALPAMKNSGNSSYRAQQTAREKKQKLESAYRAELFTRIREAAAKRSKVLLRSELEQLADRLFNRLDHDTRKRLFKALGWETKKVGNHGGVTFPLPTPIDKLADPALAQFLRDLTLAPDLFVPSYSDAKPAALERAAASLKVDAKKIRAQILQAVKAKAASKAKGKAKGKGAKS